MRAFRELQVFKGVRESVPLRAEFPALPGENSIKDWIDIGCIPGISLRLGYVAQSSPPRPAIRSLKNVENSHHPSITRFTVGLAFSRPWALCRLFLSLLTVVVDPGILLRRVLSAHKPER